jgi:hypothetical protein
MMTDSHGIPRRQALKYSGLAAAAPLLAAMRRDVSTTAPLSGTYQISVSDLDGQTTLPDGDVIRLEQGPSNAGSDQIEIALQLEGVSWWKGIQLDNIILCQAQDNQTYSASYVSFAEFESRNLNLWKAKLFGVHTPMYTVADAHTQMQGGNAYTFVWLLDG